MESRFCNRGSGQSICAEWRGSVSPGFAKFVIVLAQHCFRPVVQNKMCRRLVSTSLFLLQVMSFDFMELQAAQICFSLTLIIRRVFRDWVLHEVACIYR